ncbi:Protein kinase-like domain protein [Cordyceps fumosorosea ARSEF 2679]|uniref:Protein kinase-like domain protein n=1 Tax=Cordyceps fumosorosea (strain ARSEF 2679) TaxID=1081104 RepID=A0A168E0X8_CORFA|nr:Protein kinase-like domain protein [Cordyceps fumosorosea ARSEF 2679]OAA73246.1 Protein kinase-like domain protein [Cordyceps fumosorosea ARSEF 2679]
MLVVYAVSDMELNQHVIRQVALPSAAEYTQPPACDSMQAAAAATAYPDQESSTEDTLYWQSSILNPKNRVDSLDLPRDPCWRIDGCAGYGTQFHAVPLFLGPGPVPPQRIDVFIPDHARVPSPALRRVLDLSTAFHTREGTATRRLGIARHLVRCLQHWTATHPREALRYHAYPFGSRIVFHNVPVDARDALISVAPTHHLERQMLSPAQLRSMWEEEEDGDDDDTIALPPSIDIGELAYVAQPHDSVSVVEVAGRRLIFKAVTSHTKFLYHELRLLLHIPPHTNVVARPRHLVTKRCAFGGATAVVGFTLAYHPRGAVRDHLPRLAARGRPSLRDEVRWARQLLAALLHFRRACDTFYSDLRLDNVLLSAAANDLILVDFEQRGVWSEFAAPEVNAIECLRGLAVDDRGRPRRDDRGSRYAALLTRMLPGWEDLVGGEAYAWPDARQGFNVAWRCLRPEERESCEVYMLGRALWCLFEAQSAPRRALWTSYACEPAHAVEFPAYRRTPPEMRRLVDWCTAGHMPPLSGVVARRGDRLVLRREGEMALGEQEEEDDDDDDDDEVREAARAFWKQRVDQSERWVLRYIESRERGTSSPFPDRPGLAVVDAHLEAYFNKL